MQNRRWALLAIASLVALSPALGGLRPRPKYLPFVATQTTTVNAPPLVPNFPTMVVPGAGGGVAEVIPHRVTLPKSAVQGTFSTEVSTFPLTGVSVEGRNDGPAIMQTASGLGGRFGGAMKMLGQTTIRIGLGSAFLGTATIPLSPIGQSAMYSKMGPFTYMTPMGALATIMGLPGTKRVTGMKWGTGMVQLTNVTPTSMQPVSTIMATGFDHRNANATGTLQLVTPIRIYTALLGPQIGVSVLTLVFSPPAAAGFGGITAIGLGLALLASLEVTRRSARRRSIERASGPD